jgi:hypothetical protein
VGQRFPRFGGQRVEQSLLFMVALLILFNYLYQETVGFTKNDEKENLITREKALARLAIENVVPQRFVIESVDELGLDYRDLDDTLKRFQET